MLNLLDLLFFNNLLLRSVVLLILGLCIGSFLNVVVYRLPIMLKRKWRNECIAILADECNLGVNSNVFNLIHPASHCPNCQAKVPLWANIPLLGYFFVGCKCRFCQKRISWRYPLVELLTGIFFVATGVVFSDGWPLLGGLVFMSIIMCLILIDLDTFLLPDELTLPLIWLGLLFNLQGSLSGSLTNAVIGAIVGYLILWCIYWLFKLLTKKEGMGYGDFKLLAALGAWLGWQNLVSILLMSSLLGIIYALGLRVSGKLAKGNPIPFGPFLGGAGIVTLLFASHLFPIVVYR